MKTSGSADVRFGPPGLARVVSPWGLSTVARGITTDVLQSVCLLLVLTQTELQSIG